MTYADVVGSLPVLIILTLGAVTLGTVLAALWKRSGRR